MTETSVQRMLSRRVRRHFERLGMMPPQSADIEDMVQDVWTVLVEKGKRFKTPRALNALIRRAIRYAAARWIAQRVNYRQFEVSPELLEDTSEDHPSYLGDMLRAIPQKKDQLIAYYISLGMTVAEMQLRTGMSERSIYYSRNRLKVYLAPWAGINKLLDILELMGGQS